MLSPAHLGNHGPGTAWPKSKAKHAVAAPVQRLKRFPTLLRQHYSGDAEMLSLG